MPYKDKARQKEWDRTHRDKKNANKRKWYGSLSPEKKKAYNRRQMENAKKNQRCVHLKYEYNLSMDDFASLLQSQDNKCAICQDPFSKTPHVDHDHTTGKIRGLLCNNCNAGIGFLKDSPKLLRLAIEYLGRI
jgi:hypothetical protein